MAPRLRPLLTPPNDGTEKENKLDLRVALKKGASHETRAVAETAMNVISEEYGAKYEKTVTCLTKNREELLAFHDFPSDHCEHMRTGNPIESVFATVRHKTVPTQGAPSQKTAKLMVFNSFRPLPRPGGD